MCEFLTLSKLKASQSVTYKTLSTLSIDPCFHCLVSIATSYQSCIQAKFVMNNEVHAVISYIKVSEIDYFELQAFMM